VTTLIAVFTTRAGQSSTYWSLSLAWTLAERRRVVLMDCDMEGGTIADLLFLDVNGHSLANCFGERTTTSHALEAQAVSVRERPGLRVIPGLRGTFGYEITECLRQLRPAVAGVDADVVIADLGHPLAHPGLRSPRAAAEAICTVFSRVFVILRDEPALISRSIDVLRAARLSHGELVICSQRSRLYHETIVESLERELPDLPVRDGWVWDERRAARMAETGLPIVLPNVESEFNL